MTLRQYFIANLPTAYADRAIANTEAYCKTLLDAEAPRRHDIISCSFVWRHTTESDDFWFAVDQHIRTGSPLPPIPGVQEAEAPSLETRLSLLESRIAALESAARSAVSSETAADPEPVAPEYPTTPLPAGYDRWVCRGTGWKPGVRAVYTTRYPSIHGTFNTAASEMVPLGYDTLEYWEAVKDAVPGSTPTHYRLLSEGEVIREGDEYLEDLSIEIGVHDLWLPVEVSLGHPFDPATNAPTRRRISSHTDA